MASQDRSTTQAFKKYYAMLRLLNFEPNIDNLNPNGLKQ